MCERPPVCVAVATLHASVVRRAVTVRALLLHFGALYRRQLLLERLHSLGDSIDAVSLCRSFDAHVMATLRSRSVAPIILAPLTVQLQCA